LIIKKKNSIKFQEQESRRAGQTWLQEKATTLERPAVPFGQSLYQEKAKEILRGAPSQRAVMEGGGEKRPQQTLDSKGGNCSVPSRHWT
jgi:hypothetical protein